MGSMLGKKIMDAWTVDSTETGYSNVIDMFEFTGLSVTISWTATPTATITLQTSDDPIAGKDVQAEDNAGNGTWFDDPDVAAPNDPAGSDSQTVFNLSDVQSRYVRFKIVGTTNNGVYTAWATAKE